MSYQPPGPYPVFPQYPGGAALMPNAKPPRPAAVLRAHYCMLAGAVLALVSAGLTIADAGKLKSALDEGLPVKADGSVIHSFGTAIIVMACIFAAIECGLWIWMAYATKAGHHWARVLSTVFFGLNAAGQVFGSASLAAGAGEGTGTQSTTDASTTVPGEIVGWLSFGVGLAAIILLWNKASGPYFKPPFYPAPYGYPGSPMMPYPVMPGQPPQPGQPFQPQDAPPTGQQPPTDPWNTTPPSD